MLFHHKQELNKPIRILWSDGGCIYKNIIQSRNTACIPELQLASFYFPSLTELQQLMKEYGSPLTPVKETITLSLVMENKDPVRSHFNEKLCQNNKLVSQNDKKLSQIMSFTT